MQRAAERIAQTPPRYVPHAPTDHQAAFLCLEHLEALYGGAAGGGKSDALLMAALEYVHVPGYAALLFRRTYKDLALPEALMDRADQWLRGGDAHWNGMEKRWEFPAGSTLSFGYLEHEADKFRYQGAAFQFIGFDELTQFTESQYRYLFSRLRRLRGSEVPLRMRAASNPGGEGHEWVRARFIDGGRADGRVFIPAKLDDNPHVDRAEYERSLAQLDPVTREQLRHGNWDVRAQGPMFDRGWFKIIDEAPSGCRWVRYWDLAATEAKPGKDPDFTAGAKLGTKDGTFYLADMRRTRSRPGDVEDLVAQTAATDGNGVSIWIEQEPGSSGVNTIDHYQRRVLRGRYMQGHKKTGSKVSYARPVSSAAQAGNFFIVRGAWNSEFLDEVHAFPTPGVHDDQVDATSGAFEKVNSGGWVV
jgi:predicted phage terminase large subunit-like protein